MAQSFHIASPRCSSEEDPIPAPGRKDNLTLDKDATMSWLEDDAAGTCAAGEFGWSVYRDCTTKQIWFYNSVTDEFFYEADAKSNGWTEYADPLQSCRRWWYYNSAGIERWFWRP